MVARIRSGKSLKGAINYNEKKVGEGKAELIAAKLYHKELHKLNFHEKLNRLQNLADLNTRTTTNCLHLSLNFDPSEKLSNEELQQVAEAYMKGINFGVQPYLVYHHLDAAHQHIHIVSTNIQKDGKRISLHNLGRGLSEKTRKEIEVKFNLVKAAPTESAKLQELKPVKLGKAEYGRDQVKRAITNVVDQVISQYKFASLAEFNGILQLYNVIADRGGEGTRMFEKNGLHYSLLDGNKEKIGVPIKASSIYKKPTLKFLEQKFGLNKQDKQQFRNEVKDRIKQVLIATDNKQSFATALKNKDIDVIWRMNKDNFVYGITYVDHHTKSVFNGSDLGKEFSAIAVQSGWATSEVKAGHKEDLQPRQFTQKSEHAQPNTESYENLVSTLIDPKLSFDYLPYGFKKKRKKSYRRSR